MKKIIIVVAALIFSLCSNLCLAGEVDIDLFGFSYHFNKSGAYHSAPNRLDGAGLWVFNPGIGLGYDFRKSIKTEGFSPIVQAGFFQNCSDKPFIFGGGGLRYRKFIIGRLFWEANALGLLTRFKDWDDDNYKVNLMPYAAMGIGYDFGNNLVTLLVSYIPKNSGAGIGTDSGMSFMDITVSF